MSTELYESLWTRSQLLEIFHPFYIHMKMSSCIHGKTVNDHLGKHTVVLIGLQKGFNRVTTPLFTEIAVNVLKTRTEQTGRNDKDVCKDIDNPYIYSSQYSNQPSMHQAIAVRRTIPLLLSHCQPNLPCFQYNH